MRGFAADIQLFHFRDGFSYRHSLNPQPREEYKCIGVLCSKDYPALAKVVSAIKRGAERYPDAVWVCRERDASAIAAFQTAGVTPLELDLNPYWRSDSRDSRKEMRDAEIRCYCSHVLVFTTKESKSLDHWRGKHKGGMEFLNPGHVYFIDPPKRRGSGSPLRSDAG